ncbi:MAG: hypothetical protein KDK27_05125, partial [Leptospiraceae bacterium]|nr:hypothetical protein [Leptospiraceae bacterium]
MFSALLIVFSGRSAARYYLVGLLVNLSFGHLVHAADFFSNESPRIVMLVMNARVFLYGPLIYLFLVQSIKMRRKWHPGDVLHFFPAILSFVLLLFVSVQKNEQSRIFLFSLMLHAQILLMSIYGVRIYSQIRDYIPDPLAGKINRNCPGGQGLLVAIVMFFLLWMAQQLLMLYLEGDAGIYKHVRLIRGIIILSYTLTICYVAVRMFLTQSRSKPIASIANNMQESSVSNGEMGHVTQLHNGVRNGLDGNGDQLNEHSHDSECERKYSRSGLKSDQIPVVLDRVVHYMETCRPYLDPEFAPRDMAAALDLPVARISQVINQELQTNFYGLV